MMTRTGLRQRVVVESWQGRDAWTVSSRRALVDVVRCGSRMTTEERWARLVALAGEPATVDRQALLQDVVALGLDEVAAAVLGCSITETEPAGGRSAAISNALAAALDQAQFDADDGPCLRAARVQRSLRLDLIGEDDRFSSFATAAGRLGVLSSLSVPIPRTATPTSLNLYAGRPGAFTPERCQAIAGLLARCAAPLLAAPGEATGPRVPAAALAEALSRRDIVQQAQRRLAAGHNLTEPEAFRQLARWTQLEGCSIAQVAQKVLDGQLVADRPAGPEQPAAPEDNAAPDAQKDR